MDTSETYIKMCDCEEIQEQSSDSEGNWWIGGDMVFCIGAYEEEMVHEGYTWLPTQEQLQEMVIDEKDSENKYIVLLDNFLEWILDDCTGWSSSPSMEQLWLAFVMKKHNKTWDGEKWVE